MGCSDAGQNVLHPMPNKSVKGRVARWRFSLVFYQGSVASLKLTKRRAPVTLGKRATIQQMELVKK
ncbi:MAG: hypothetical protein CTY16_09655 [Methylobacter sp.]|nr:MAG: hypothetical protein CTY16_09655 [Methylobacter sp.]